MGSFFLRGLDELGARRLLPDQFHGLSKKVCKRFVEGREFAAVGRGNGYEEGIRDEVVGQHRGEQIEESRCREASFVFSPIEMCWMGNPAEQQPAGRRGIDMIR